MTYRIMLADDREDLRIVLGVALSSFDLDIVAAAGNGIEAIEMAERTQPDVVVLDLYMPVMTGRDALPGIKRASSTSKILVLTSSDDSVERADAMALGADGFLDKTASTDEIALAIIDLCELTEPGEAATG